MSIDQKSSTLSVFHSLTFTVISIKEKAVHNKEFLSYSLFDILCIFQGYEPYFVNATAGTTVLGVYDPLTEISEVCKRHGLWLHVDGAWGGSAAISKTYRHLVKGIER